MNAFIHAWRFASEAGFWFWVTLHDTVDWLCPTKGDSP